MKKKLLFCHASHSTKHNVKEFELSPIMQRVSLQSKQNKKRKKSNAISHAHWTKSQVFHAVLRAFLG